MLKKVLVLFIVSLKLHSQQETCLFPKLHLGFSHSAFNGLTFNSGLKNFNLIKGSEDSIYKSKVIEIQYGFAIGAFLWIPLNEAVVFKPKVEIAFSNTLLNINKSVRAVSLDANISHNFAIALKPANKNGVIYIAKDMSCYLTSKQPYLLIGPKLNFKKFDNGYIHKGFQHELSYGLMIGYGINYEFHGTNFIPEITYCLSTTAQNQTNDYKKVSHVVAISINFF